jgi:hypothetical protein
MQQLYLTRRNLLSLLSKLDRQKKGERTFCTLVKSDTIHPYYPSTDVITVTAVEDEDYYVDRAPGKLHPADEPKTE